VNAAFIVTSAICTSIGIFDTKTRVQQTNRTLCSIQDYAPNSKIIFIEGGEKPKDQYAVDFLKEVQSKVYLFGFNSRKLNDFEEAKKFFVGSTRAMNELIIFN